MQCRGKTRVKWFLILICNSVWLLLKEETKHEFTRKRVVSFSTNYSIHILAVSRGGTKPPIFSVLLRPALTNCPWVSENAASKEEPKIISLHALYIKPSLVLLPVVSRTMAELMLSSSGIPQVGRRTDQCLSKLRFVCFLNLIITVPLRFSCMIANEYWIKLMFNSQLL